MPSPIKRLFVLMLENRSFDHLFGNIPFSGKTPEGNPTTVNGLSYRQFGTDLGAADTLVVGPGHEFGDTLVGLCGFADESYWSGMNGDKYDIPIGGKYPPVVAPEQRGFAYAYQHQANVVTPDGSVSQVMQTFSPEDLPVLIGLAQGFAVCDAWYSSMPGPTWPNRFFAVAGTSGGLDYSPSTADMLMANSGVHKYKFDNGTLFEALSAQNIPWQIAYGDVPITLALDGLSENWTQFVKLDDFLRQMAQPPAASDPQFVFIEPKYDPFNKFLGGNSMHCCGNAQYGEVLVQTVYDAFRNSHYWTDSALLIVFDEHGGFFDHDTPPAATPPGDTSRYNRHNFGFDQLGVRVPAIVVSAYTAPGTIDHTAYDHTSILATADVLLNQGRGQLRLGKRAQQAASFDKLFSMPGPRDKDEVKVTLRSVDLPPLPASKVGDTVLGEASSVFTAVVLEMARLGDGSPNSTQNMIEQTNQIIKYHETHIAISEHLNSALQ